MPRKRLTHHEWSSQGPLSLIYHKFPPSILLVASPTAIRAHTVGVTISWFRRHGPGDHGLRLATVLVHGPGATHYRRHSILRRLELIAPLPAQVVPVRQHLGRVLFVFGVLDQFLVLARSSLLDAAEDEDGEDQDHDSDNDTNDDPFGGAGEPVPFLFHALGSGLAVFAVELDGFGVTVKVLAVVVDE